MYKKLMCLETGATHGALIAGKNEVIFPDFQAPPPTRNPWPETMPDSACVKACVVMMGGYTWCSPGTFRLTSSQMLTVLPIAVPMACRVTAG